MLKLWTLKARAWPVTHSFPGWRRSSNHIPTRCAHVCTACFTGRRCRMPGVWQLQITPDICQYTRTCNSRGASMVLWIYPYPFNSAKSYTVDAVTRCLPEGTAELVSLVPNLDHYNRKRCEHGDKMYVSAKVRTYQKETYLHMKW